MSFDEIRALIVTAQAAQEANLQKLEESNLLNLQKLEVAITTRFEISLQQQECMTNVMLEASIKRLENSFEERLASKLELRTKDRDDENEDPAAQEAKRRRRSLSAEPGTGGMRSNARDHAESRRDDEVRHTIVFTAKNLLLTMSNFSSMWC